ncbi:MAG: acyltransferase [Planctomycetaceae bacterium]|nr:acyltransferase [Planctomycetaceae bacterium]
MDALRGLAVVGILAVHVPHDAPGGWRQNPWFFPSFGMDFGHIGVPLFVMISGFCIHLATAKHRRNSGDWHVRWCEFWTRRIYRLYPPYIAAIVFSLCMAATSHDRYSMVEDFSLKDLFAHLLLIHNLTDNYSLGLGNGVFWSLGMEEQLYGLYFLLLVALRTFNYPTAVVLPLLASLLWRLYSPGFTDNSDAFAFWPFSYWAFWILGAIAADHFIENIKLPEWCTSIQWSIFCLTCGICLSSHTVDQITRARITSDVRIEWLKLNSSGLSALSELGFCFGFFFLLNFLIKREQTEQTQLCFFGLPTMGRLSYSIYLTHFPVMHSLEYLLPIYPTTLGWLLRIVSYTGISLIVGVVFYCTVERHFLSKAAAGKSVI